MEAIVASIIITLITVAGTVLAARANARALTRNASTSSRAVMEEEAYQRARAYDVETIARQEKELKALRENSDQLSAKVDQVLAENGRLHAENRVILEDNARLRAEMATLRGRVTRIQRGVDETAPIRERDTDTNPLMREILDNGRE